MSKTLWLTTLVITMAFWASHPTLVLGESLEQVEEAVDNQYLSGEIADPEVAEAILEVINDPNNEGSAEEEAALRESIVDMVDSFSGSEMSPEAAESIKGVTTQP